MSSQPRITQKSSRPSWLAGWSRGAATVLAMTGAACDEGLADATSDVGEPSGLEGAVAVTPPFDSPFHNFATATPERVPGLDSHGAALPSSAKRPRPGPVMMIITEDALMPVAKEWASYRASVGFRVEIRAVSELEKEAQVNRIPFDAAARKQLIRMLDETHAQRSFLLLLGDAPAGGSEKGRIPAAECPNQTPGAGGCWTDNQYGDLDGDGLPEIAVGRVPAHDVDEARRVLAKVQEHEAHYRVGVHNRRVSLYVGESGFGDGIDEMLETLMMRGLELMSYDFDIRGAWDNPSSSYWFFPFTDKVVDLYNEGALMTVYMGHGSETWTQGLSSSDVERVSCNVRRPVSLFFACYAGAFVGDDDSLSETLLFKSDGSIAAYGASEVSHPFANAVLAYESQRVASSMSAPTIGETIVAFERALIENGDDEFRALIAGAAMIEGSTNSLEKQEALLREHVALYNLLGDPATSMQYPKGRVAMPEPVVDLVTRTVTVSGRAAGIRDGHAIVTLEVPRDVIAGDLSDFDPSRPDQKVIAANWETANDKIVADLVVPVSDGHFIATIPVDESLSTRIAYRVKVYAHDGIGDAFGSIALPRLHTN